MAEGTGGEDDHCLAHAAYGLTITVDYATSDGSATAGEDHTAVVGTLRFAPGVTGQIFGVALTDDALDESDETVTLMFLDATNAAIGSNSPVTLPILDDDLSPPSCLMSFTLIFHW